MSDFSAIILAAGRGSRFTAGGGATHKAIAPVRDTTPLLWTLSVLSWCGAPPVTVVVGYRADEIRAAVLAAAYPGTVTFVDNDVWATTDSAYSFGLAMGSHPGGPVLLTYGDVLLAPPLVERFRTECHPHSDVMALDTTRPFAAWDMRAEVSDNRLRRLGKDLPQQESAGEAACVFRFSERTARSLAARGLATRTTVPAVQFERMLSPLLGELEIGLLRCGPGEWCEVDVPAEIVLAEELVDRVRASRESAGAAW